MIEEPKEQKSAIRELFEFAIVAIIIVVPFRIYIAQPFIVSGASMDPTFHNGEYLIVDQISYRFEEPKRGSVVIFRYPNDPKQYFIKRIIGLPGETITIQNGIVTIKTPGEETPLRLVESYIEFGKQDSSEITLGSDEFFVMGDNRAASSDSRIWGPLNKKYIVGRPFVRLFPPFEFAVFPGDYSSTK